MPPAAYGSRLERWSWYFTRLSGVALVLLAFGHMAIMHLLGSVDQLDYLFVATRWQTVGWRVYDWLLLALALAHGQNCLRIMIDDYVRPRPWRRLAHAANLVALAAILALGTLAIALFPAAGALTVMH
jgi:succinate dehydrogenase / fumarate reductase membrane anchor subunit